MGHQNTEGGQDRAFAILRNLMAKNRLPHAILLTGREGIGKTAFALEVAKVLLCEKRSDSALACGTCGSCRKVEALIHPDLIMVRAEGNVIKINQVRAIIEETSYRVRGGHFRVIIIEEAEKLSDEASNALLKILEEPPTGNIFLLTSSRYYQLLPTIRSRCCKISLQPVPTNELLRVAEERLTLSKEEILSYVLLANGSHSKLMELLKAGTPSPWVTVSLRVKTIREVPMWKFFTEITRWLEEHQDLEALLRYLKSWLVIIIRKHEEASPRHIDKYLDFFETIEEAEQSLRFNVNKTLLLEEIGMRIREDLYE
ncbi:MAG: DNA polymerase III subunit delta' [Syntrophobacterales bacterium]|nr:DNA polymerase III subunit delta' [Syntrophobacterales bacterium]